MIREAATAILLFAGAGFMLLSAIGILRMPDLYTRMSATSKAASLGSGLMLAGVAFHFQSVAVTTRALAAIVFVFLTVPVAAHVIGRAAYQFGVPLWRHTQLDELRGKYDPATFRLSGHPIDDAGSRGRDDEGDSDHAPGRPPTEP